MTHAGQVREWVAAARRENGPVDVLINNAGVIQVGPLDEMREPDFQRSLETHFWAAYHAINEVLPEVKARRARRIVNIASVGGKVAVPHLMPYSVGKFALVGFSNGLRSGVRRHGVTVTTLCPGLMRTGSHVNAEFKGRHEEEYAWFALTNGLPGLSVSGESAARAILSACARGDAELVLGLPAKFIVAVQALFPNLTADAMAVTNRWLLPSPGGIGPATATGAESRGRLPAVATALTDRAAAAANE
ncbi:KR domain-containing protein [Limnoglobus roseus]|uniref:KR domain-containing protein n=1 Tax=Limnoglobus roseus TaxID=2598579 RepID=A0A5C1AR22_9BACT|nr:KR domain-containing protein [Limnoglobus roseus]